MIAGTSLVPKRLESIFRTKKSGAVSLLELNFLKFKICYNLLQNIKKQTRICKYIDKSIKIDGYN